MLRRSDRLLFAAPLVLSCLLAPSLADAVAPRMEVQVRVQGADGVHERSIAPGAVLSSADEVRLRITSSEPGYLYVVAIGSSGSALLLHPFGGADPSPVHAGEVVAVPGDGAYLPLHGQPGTESLVAFVTPGVEMSLPPLLTRLEDARAAGQSISEVLAAQGYDAAVSSFDHAPSLTANAAGSPAALGTAGSDGKGVLSGLGSRIASFTGAAGGAEPGATPAVPAAMTADVKDDAPAPREPASGGFLSAVTGLFGASADEQRSEATATGGTAEPGGDANSFAPGPVQESDSASAPARPPASVPEPASTAGWEASAQRPPPAVDLPPQTAANAVPRDVATDRSRAAVATGSGGGASAGAPRPTGRFVQPLAIEATMAPAGVSADPVGAAAPAGDAASPPEPRPGGRVEGTLARLFEGGPHVVAADPPAQAAATQPSAESLDTAPAEASFAEDRPGLPPVETRGAESVHELGLLSTLQELLGISDPLPAPVQPAADPAPANASPEAPAVESPASTEPAPGARREPDMAPSSGFAAAPGNSPSAGVTPEQASGGGILAGLASLFGGTTEVAASEPARADEPEAEAATIIAAGDPAAVADAGAGFTVESTTIVATSTPAAVVVQPARSEVSRLVPASADGPAASPSSAPFEAAEAAAPGSDVVVRSSEAGVEAPGGARERGGNTENRVAETTVAQGGQPPPAQADSVSASTGAQAPVLSELGSRIASFTASPAPPRGAGGANPAAASAVVEPPPGAGAVDSPLDAATVAGDAASAVVRGDSATELSPGAAGRSNGDADATAGLLARLFGGGSAEPVPGAAATTAAATVAAEAPDSQASASAGTASAMQQDPAGRASGSVATAPGAGSADSLAVQETPRGSARVGPTGGPAPGMTTGAVSDANAVAGPAREERSDGVESSPQSGGLLASLGALFSGSSEPGPAAATPAASYLAKADRTEPDTAAVVAPVAPAATPMRAGGAVVSASPARDDGGAEPVLTRATDDSGRALVRLEGGRAPTPKDGGNDEVLSAAGSRISVLLDGPRSNTSKAGIAGRAPAAASAPSSGGGGAPTAAGVASAAAGGLAIPPAVPDAATLALAQLDLESGAGPAGAVVLIVTASGTAGGVLVDSQGHVLTRWHEVREHDSVTVVFRQARAPGAVTVDRQRARLIAHSKFADLALLRVDTVPAGHRPAELAADTETIDGASLHAVALAEDGTWRQAVARDARVQRNSSWYSPHRVLHRADVIRARVGGDAAAAAGSALFNERMELVGLAAMIRADRGELIGVSTATLRAFLQGTG